MKKIEKVIMVGRGAVGVTYASTIQKAIGNDCFAFVQDEERTSRYIENPLILNGEKTNFRYISNAEDFGQADLILIATKNSGLQAAAKDIQPFVKDDTIIMSCINGIASEDYLRSLYPKENVLRTIAQKMDSRYANNCVDFTQRGEIVFGNENERDKENADLAQAFFEKIGLPYVRSEDIVKDAWNKLLLNCAINQVCAAYGLTYGTSLDQKEYKDMLIGIMKEVQEIAKSQNVILEDEKIEAWMDAIAHLGYDSMPSMAQDMLAKRKTEKALFSGTLLPIAEREGIAAPLLKQVYDRITEIEDSWS